MESDLIHSTLSETWNNDIPPIAFEVDTSGTTMELTKFPQPGCYLKLSRGPSKDQTFEVWGYRSEKSDYGLLKKIIQRLFYDSKYIPLRLRNKGHVNLAGVKRISREFTTSRGANKKRWSAVLVPSPDGEPYGLVVLFSIYVGVRKLGLSSVVKHPVHARLAKSFGLSHTRTAMK
ncbi:MAG: hypothetical protein P1Q69_07600 [Candidatus Thorarchaeota archaeon]|nr:hypothetical protein [Candidatus Thorarchaeota archaeon]